MTQLKRRVSYISKVIDDSEFRYKYGIVYINRLATNDALNEQSKTKVDKQFATEQVPFTGRIHHSNLLLTNPVF